MSLQLSKIVYGNYERRKRPFVTVEEGEKIRVGLSASMRAPGLIDSFNLRETRLPWNPYADPGFLRVRVGYAVAFICLCTGSSFPL